MDSKNSKHGFTLIEVMIAVVIISTVIMALLQMFANNTHIFSQLSKKTEINQYSSFFISNPTKGLENIDTLTLYDLIDDFQIEDSLRQKLKKNKIKIIYQEVETIDMSDFQEEKKDDNNEDDEEKKDVNSNMIFTIGKTILRLNNSSISLLRLNSQ